MSTDGVVRASGRLPERRHLFVGCAMFTAYDDSSSSSSEEGGTTSLDKRASVATSTCPRPSSSSSRIVIHLDVDAFYCQCEELRDNSLKLRSFAVGQKHIIVTCNYVARRAGVTKLMLRTTAKKVCPDLIIVEGSDLQPYRRQSRKIYTAFRKAVAALPGGTKNLARKGGMDEMFADVTFAVDSIAGSSSADGEVVPDTCMFVYGDDSSSTHVSISEDQSGATAVAFAKTDTSTEAIHFSHEEQDAERSTLRIAAKFAATIRAAVKRDTGFTACVGVSTSPMLAKLASELRKPDSLNVLYSWRASSIVNAMPLRKVPGLGSRTLRSLTGLLEKHNGTKLDESSYWKCQDLLRVPRDDIIDICGDERSEILYERCRGIDPVHLEDDDGGLSKTVSVEDSYKRGSLGTIDGVQKALHVLYQRLPELLDDRQADSDRSDLAYPSTIRFSARFVDEMARHERHPCITSSKQCKFDGKFLMMSAERNDRVNILRRAVDPLMNQVLCDADGKLDVTKLNIAVTGFADIAIGGTSGTDGQQKPMTEFFAGANGSGRKKSSASGNAGAKRKTLDKFFQDIDKSSSPTTKSSPKKRSGAAAIRDEQAPPKIDPSFLAALPPDLRAEILADNQVQNAERLRQSADSSNKKKKKGPGGNGRIENYFFK